MVKNYYIVNGLTESGDDWYLLFSNPPSQADILLAIEDDPWLFEEYEAGCIQGWTLVATNLIEV